MALNYRIDESQGVSAVFLKGSINEDSAETFAELKGKLAGGAVINFRDVDMVNSCGVREWIGFLKHFSESVSLTFEECTPEIIDQINMIPPFRAHAKIHSLYVTWVCDSCSVSRNILFAEGVNMPSSPDDDPAPQLSLIHI